MPHHERDMFDRELGFRLKTLRQMRRMSQQDLGTMLGVSFQQVQRYETGTNRMAPERIHACALAFDIDVGYFFGMMDGTGHTNSQSGGRTGTQYDKRVLTLASSIAALPSEEVTRQLYQLTLAIGCALDNNEKSNQYKSLSQ